LIGEYGYIERNILRKKESFKVKLGLRYKGFYEKLESERLRDNKQIVTENKELNLLFVNNGDLQRFLDKVNWVVGYWTSKLSTDSFQITNLISPNPQQYLVDALNGIHPNIEVTQLICYFDYIRGSDSETEKQAGEYLFDQLKRIIGISLSNGELAYVSRARLEPIIKQNGQEITLDKLSSGNLYLTDVTREQLNLGD
jgi:hypothetical protein